MCLFKRFGLICLSILFPFYSFAGHKADSFENPDLITIGAGVFDIIKNPNSALFQFEYKSTFTNYRKARPIVGMFVTTQGGLYAYGGLALDIFFSKRVVATPSFAPGLYYRGNGKKLWFPLEFRSSMELSYVFKNKSRLGAQFYHISNASLGKKNPGVEALLVTYSFAL